MDDADYRNAVASTQIGPQVIFDTIRGFIVPAAKNLAKNAQPSRLDSFYGHLQQNPRKFFPAAKIRLAPSFSSGRLIHNNLPASIASGDSAAYDSTRGTHPLDGSKCPTL